MKEDLAWKHQDTSGLSIELRYDDGLVSIHRGEERTEWPIASFFQEYAPCHDFPIDMQNEIMSALALRLTKDNVPLPDDAKVVHFWLAFPSLDIQPQEFHYETKVTNAYHWDLMIDRSGLRYIDIDGDYGYARQAYHQTHSDFWFYGPLYPIPDQALRSELISKLKDALLDAGFDFPESHFKLLDYPSFAHFAQWVDGDYIVSDFVITRDYGIEWGRQNFHDGLVFLGFLSYEQCLTRTKLEHWIMTKDILASIRKVIQATL